MRVRTNISAGDPPEIVETPFGDHVIRNGGTP